MALRVCLFDEIGVTDTSFRPPFERLDGVTVVDLCANWDQLQEYLTCGNIDAVAVNLDTAEEAARLYLIERIAEVATDCAVIGVSSDTNPDTIIGAMRAGCTQFVRAPIDPADLRNAIDRIRQTRHPIAAGSQTIAVIGSSGGAGATTVACNLALELARVTERRIALVDMNLQFGDVACAFDVVPKHSVADICRPGIVIDRTLLEMAMDELPCKVSLLGRPENLEDSEEVTADSIEQLFRCLAPMFPFVVADFPRSFTHNTLAALRTADRVLIVSQVAVPFLRNATRIFESLLQAGIDERHVEFVLNRCHGNHERITMPEVEKHFGRPVFAAVPNDYKRITASRDLGHPIMNTAPNSPARIAIEELARKLVAAQEGEGNGESGKSGFLGMFRRKRAKDQAPAK